MSISRTSLWLAVLAFAAGLPSPARAQFPNTNHEFGGAGFWEPEWGVVQPQLPFDYFEPDYQFFAPADVDTYGGYPEPNVGFFFTYERLYWNVQRSETQPQPFEGDFAWGNRVDFGYMMEDDHGWLFSAFHLDGPNAFGGVFTFFEDRNLPQDDIDDFVSVPVFQNVADFEGAEINKTFRWKPVGRNYIIEPMFGIRFMKFVDRDPDIEIVELLDDQGFTILTTQFGTLNVIENNILGGQLGARIHHQTERWVKSLESKFVPAVNYQFYPDEDYSEFTIFGQISFKITYNLTRDISLGGGADIMHFGRGIARGAQSPVDINDQDLTIGGMSIVFQINR